MLPASLRARALALNTAGRSSGAFLSDGDHYQAVNAAARGQLDRLRKLSETVGDFGRTLMNHQRAEYTPAYYAVYGSNPQWKVAAFLANNMPCSWHVQCRPPKSRGDTMIPSAVEVLNTKESGLVQLLRYLVAAAEPINVRSVVALIVASSSERRQEVLKEGHLLTALFTKVKTTENVVIAASLSIGSGGDLGRLLSRNIGLLYLYACVLKYYVQNLDDGETVKQMLEGKQSFDVSFILRQLLRDNLVRVGTIDGSFYYVYDGLCFGYSSTDSGFECRPLDENVKIIEPNDVDRAGSLLPYIQGLKEPIDVDQLIRVLVTPLIMDMDVEALKSRDGQAAAAQLLKKIPDAKARRFVRECLNIAKNPGLRGPLKQPQEPTSSYRQYEFHLIATDGPNEGRYFDASPINNHELMKHSVVGIAGQGNVERLRGLYRDNDLETLCGSPRMDENDSRQTTLDAAIRAGHWPVVAFLQGVLPPAEWGVHSVQATRTVVDATKGLITISKEDVGTPVNLINMTRNGLLQLITAIIDSEEPVSAAALSLLFDQLSVERSIELWRYWINNRHRLLPRISQEAHDDLHRRLKQKAQVSHFFMLMITPALTTLRLRQAEEPIALATIERSQAELFGECNAENVHARIAGFLMAFVPYPEVIWTDSSS